MGTEIQEFRRDLNKLREDISFIKKFLLASRTNEATLASEELSQEFQEWDFLSDEAFNNFEKSLNE